jgi:hypothetical protein
MKHAGAVLLVAGVCLFVPDQPILTSAFASEPQENNGASGDASHWIQSFVAALERGDYRVRFKGGMAPPKNVSKRRTVFGGEIEYDDWTRFRAVLWETQRRPQTYKTYYESPESRDVYSTNPAGDRVYVTTITYGGGSSKKAVGGKTARTQRVAVADGEHVWVRYENQRAYIKGPVADPVASVFSGISFLSADPLRQLHLIAANLDFEVATDKKKRVVLEAELSDSDLSPIRIVGTRPSKLVLTLDKSTALPVKAQVVGNGTKMWLRFNKIESLPPGSIDATFAYAPVDDAEGNLTPRLLE